MSPTNLHFASLLLYSISTALALARLFQRTRTTLDRAFNVTMAAAFVLHTGSIIFYSRQAGHIPLTNLFESLQILAWFLVLFFFTALLVTRIAVLSFFVTPFVLLLSAWSFLLSKQPVAPPQGAATSLFWFHILFSLLGLAGLVIGVAFSWMYEIQEKSLRNKSSGRLSRLMPSLQTCDRWGRLSVSAGFVLYTFGILHAALWSHRSKGTYLDLSAKELGSVLVWVIFAILLQARMTWGPHGRSQAILGAAGVAAIIVTLAGIR